MSKILFAWEFGDYLGHVGNLVPLMRALARRGHEVSLVAKNLASAHRLLAPGEAAVFQAPLYFSSRPRTATRCFADILKNNGYADADSLEPLVQAWRSLFSVVAPDAVVFDYAPTAQLACLERDFPRFVCGNSYYHPEPGCSAIDMCYWSDTPFDEGRASEAQVLAAIRTVLPLPAVQQAQYLGDLLNSRRQFIPHYPDYDLYRSHRTAATYVTPIASPGHFPAPRWREDAPYRVFAYLKTDKPQVDTVMTALASSGLDVVCFMSGEGADRFAEYSSDRLTISDQPLDLTTALSQADLAICHAGMGVISSSLYHGCPLLLLPTQPEQIHNTLRTEALGAGLGLRKDQTPESVNAIIQRLLHEPQWRETAQAIARDYRASAPVDSVAFIADEIERALL